ncbi:huntingtin isoform X2 [Diachasmimorpha longicaudata]|uniref:huntingtin isoform X2 n=1 Tax=Diachasmimorpha longicaudata TaxID=58733 RepID=UPI0030B8977A
MAAVASVLRAIESLNAVQGGQSGLDSLTRMEKMTSCTTIVNGMTSPAVKTTKNFAQILGLSIKTLLCLCNDEDSDVRMMADECLNRIIRSTSDGNVLKIQFELYNEIHRNASSRSLRAALKRFALLSHTIRPIKGKAYISNLIPSLVAISKRPEEEVIDTLAQSLPLILKSLGPFMTDKDAKTLLKTFYPNLSSPQAVFRRNAGNMILATCLHCRKPRIVLFYALRHLIDTMISVNRTEENLHLVVGILGCIRIMLPHVDQPQESDHETDAHKLDCLLQTYELCLRYVQRHSDHNVINAALETLAQLLRSPNEEFVVQLTSKSGISGGSRIISFQRTLRMSSSDSTESEEGNRERNNADTVEVNSISAKESIQDHKSEKNLSGSQVSTKEKHHEETSRLNIGNSLDADVPLKFCCRYLCSCFLLAGRPTELIPDNLFRVSVKSLALTCIGGIIRLYPNILLQTLEKSSRASSENSQMISDILLFSKHSDPQLRGNVAMIVGLFLNSVFVKYWGSYNTLEREIQQTNEGKIIDLNHLINLLTNSLEDESATTSRQALQSLDICLTSLLQSEESHHSLRILFKLLPLSDNPYFLVKMNLSNVLSELPFITIKYLTTSSTFQSDVTQILVKLLGDQDPRVRNAAAKAFVTFTTTSYHQSPHEDECLRKTSQYIEQCLNPFITINLDSKGYQLDQKFFVNSLVDPFLSFYSEPRRPNTRDHIEESLSIIVGLLAQKLFTYPSRYLSYGCFEALSDLSQSYPTTLYPDAWDCRQAKTLMKKPTSKVHASNRSITSESIDFPSSPDHLSPIGTQLLSLTISLLSSDPVSLDLVTHKHMIILAGNLIAGISLRNLKTIDLNEKSDNISKMWALFEDREVNRHLELLFVHIMRLINIFVHVIDGIQVPSSSKSGLPSLPTTPSLSPRKKIHQDKPKERKDNVLTNSFRAKEPIGAFSSLPHYLRFHDILKAAHMNYVSTLDVDSSQMYLGLLDSALQVLSQIFEVASTFEARKVAEEVLHYLEATLALSPSKTVQCVRQLLKSLFGTNLSVRWDELEDVRSPDDRIKNPEELRRGLYDHCFQKPGRQMADVIKSIGNTSWSNENELKRSSSTSSFHRRDSDRKMVLAFKSFARTTNQKAFFVSFIRIFETMVIKSLNQYTTTSSVSCQCQVLSLLSQLVQFHVNYCLLDTDKTFIDFVLGQFPFIEESQIPHVQQLLPKIFGFLVHLSYEKYHSKMIIDIREIIKLCDGLMASGQPPTTHCIPALVPVIEDLFLARSSALKTPGEKAELDTTREYLMSMLLRLVEYHPVIELLAQCLSECRSDEDGEEKWRKWSRMTMDVVLPALACGKIRIELEVAGVAIIKLFSTVSPSCFRPVDPLLKILFTVPPGLNEPRIKLERWLGMVNIVILSLIAYAKEETMLSRLAELSVFMTELVHTLDLPDTFTIYDTADPLNATNVESCSLSPERILAIFAFRVIFLASSKICLTLNSVEHRDNLLHNRQRIYLLQELAFFLQLCIHMFESGSHCKVANATIQMLNDEELIPIEKLNSLMLEISMKNCPILTTHWTYLMTLLGYNNKDFWSKTLGTKIRNLSPTEDGIIVNIDTKIVRQCATILFSDHICENMSDTESLTWLVMNHIEETMNLANESPVRDLVTAAVHRNPAASGLLIQAISARCLDLSRPSFVKRLLRTLESAHEDQSGAVILSIIPRFISLSHLVLGKAAGKIAAKRVELLLSLPEEEVLKQLPKEDLLTLMETLHSTGLAKKHGFLLGLINNLATRFYDLSPLELEHCRSFNPSTVQNIHLDKPWFLSQVRLKCCNPTSNPPDSSEAAELLSNLDLEDCDNIFMSKNFDLRILAECIHLGTRLTLEEDTGRTAFVRSTDFSIQNKQTVGEGNSECLSPLYQSSRQCLLIHVRNIIDLLPKTHAVYSPCMTEDKNLKTLKYSKKFQALMEDQIFWDRVFTLIPAVTAYLETLKQFNNRGITCNIPKFDEEDLSKFAVLCLEIIHWMTFTRSLKPHELELSLTCATELLKNENVSKIFGSESHYSWVCSASNTLTKLLEYWISPDDSSAFSLPPVDDRGILQALKTDATKPYALACLQMSSLISWLEKTDHSSRQNDLNIPQFIKNPLTSLIIIISRQDLVNSFVLTPPLVWKHGWMIEGSGPTLCHFPLLLSTVESNFLQELDILRQFVYRITLLGWTSRLQFEEIWMALLSVLSAASSENDSGESEGSSIQSTSLAVQGITRLLTQTLILPHPGNPINSIAMHHCRDPPLSLQKPASQRLYIVQDLLSWKYQSSRDSRLPKDSFLNFGVDSLGLEHLFTRGNIERERLTTGFDELLYSQLSVSYLWALCSLHEDKLSASVLILKERRNQALASDCLDLDSCVRFLIELYTRWLLPSSGTPLRLLNEVVRSIISTSDLFVERGQFQWMFDTCSEMERYHTTDDDILHNTLVFAVCKSAAVLTPLDIESLEKVKRAVDNGLKTSYLPGRIATLHGILFLLQSAVQANCEETMNVIHPLAIKYIHKHIESAERPEDQSEEHQRTMWALVFFLLEHAEDTPPDAEAPAVLELALSLVSSRNVSVAMNQTILQGLERLVATKSVVGRVADQIVKVSLERLKSSCSLIAIPAFRLLLTCMYSEAADRFNRTAVVKEEQPLPDIEPEALMRTIERTSAIFDRIKKGQNMEVRIFCAVLSEILGDFFPPFETLTKVIGEFLSPQQPHQRLVSGVVFKVCERVTGTEDQLTLLQDWVVFSLSTFIQSLPLVTSTWCLSCFFVSASTNKWLRALFPHVQSRMGKYEYEDKKILCVAAADFYKKLSNASQREAFLKSFEAAGKEPGSPFCDIMTTFQFTE